MEERNKRNELLITLADINNLISKLERQLQYEKTTDIINQLLSAYDIKVKILNNL